MNTQSYPIQLSSKSQKYLGEKGLIILVAFVSAFIPLSTDLYLPALPRMAEHLNAAPSLINLTLSLFFVFFAAGTLFWGPLSDKYGRKRILLSGLILYTAASAFCALSVNIYQLIGFRILQAIASGAVTSVGSAVVKDVYTGRKRESVLALVSSMVMMSPIVAPVIGALILHFTSWRGVFWALTGIGLLAIVGGFAMEETIERRYKGNILQSMGRLAVVAKNPGFASLLLTFSIMAIPLMSFVSSSSYIYIDQFGLSEQEFSYFFAGNALFLVLGPLLYIRMSRYYNRSLIITASYVVICISGILIGLIGPKSPWLFALSLLPSTLAASVIRPPSSNLMLEQQQEGTGSAASLMAFSFTFMGSLGMAMISLNWANRIMVMGFLYFIIGLLSLILWLVVSKKPFVRQVQ